MSERPEVIYCPAQTVAARMYVDPTPAEYCENEVADYGDYCPEHDTDDFDPWGTSEHQR